MKDIVPELYDKIYTDYQDNYAQHAGIQTFLEKLNDNEATLEDVCRFSAYVGECASNAVCRNLVPDNLPDGTLFWNIATRTIVPLLHDVHSLITAVAQAVQKAEDEKIGLGIGSAEADFPEERVHDLIDKILEMWGDAYGNTTS